MNFLDFGCIPGISHCIFTDIPRSEKTLKSETLLITTFGIRDPQTYT